MASMVSVSIIRELAHHHRFNLCWKNWLGIGAELGSMKVTEQIDAMEVSGNQSFQIFSHYTNFSNYLDVTIISNRGRFHCHLRLYLVENIKEMCRLPYILIRFLIF